MFQGTNFGASTTTPFGQSTFGKPATTGFNTPVFGSTGGTSLFGGPTTQPSGNLFGSSTSAPAFGQPQTTQPTFGGGFSSGTGTTGLFGSQQNANTGIGGVFGSGTTSTFGQAKPAFGGFGTNQQSTGLFGQQAQQPQQQTSLFGQPAGQSATGLFGSTFANTAQGGTTIKFTPVTGSDTMVKNGVSTTISTRHQCITCMKEYESKSLEELRLEDYTANRKGPQQGAQTGSGLFGTGGQTSLFGANTNTANTSGFGSAGTSVFGTGSNTGNTLFGKTTGTGAPAFGTPATTAATGFGFNSNTNLFGSNTQQVKPFGTPTQSPGLFGATSQPSTGFGTQTTGFGAFGTQQPGGLFTQNKPTFNLGNATSTGFGFGPTAIPSTTGTSLFGTKPATTGFGGFGTPSTTTTGFGTTGFGTTNQNTSLFGSNFKSPTNFTFGQTSTNNTLGTGLSLGTGTTSLFGNTANKPVFGQATTNTGIFGGGIFGNSTSPFNTTTSTGLGQTCFSLGNTGSNLLQGGGLGVNQAASGNNTINQHMLALASMPFGDSPLFKNLLTGSGKADELIKPTSPAAQKALISGQNYKISPKSGSKIKVKPIGVNSMTKKSLFDGLESDEENANDFQFNSRLCPKRLVLKPRLFSESNNRSYLFSDSNGNDSGGDVSAVSPSALAGTSTSPTTTATVTTPVGATSTATTPSRFISPSLASKSRASDLLSKDTPTGITTQDKPSLRKPIDSISPDDTINELRSQSKSTPTSSPAAPDTSKDVAEQSTSSSSGESELEDTVAAEIDGDCDDHPTGIVLRRIGYYTIPPLDKLTSLMDSDGRCIVDNFTIGRLNYGNIFYPDSFDVAGLNIDEIVHFRHKEVVVYPDDDKKPPVGSGLNRKAQVTLDRVWPIDKTTRLPISDPVRIAGLDYENKLRQASAKHGTRFVEYRPHTGSWVFKVEHFSKYGLSDSDEEENTTDQKKMELTNMQGATLLMKTPALPPPVTFPHKITTGLSGIEPPSNLLLGEEDEDMEDGINTPFDLDDELERGTVLSPTSKLARQLGTSSHKVQLMKVSFFEHEDYNIDGDSLDYEQVPDMNGYVNEFNSSQHFDPSKMAALPFYRNTSFAPVEPDVSESDLLEMAESLNMKTRDMNQRGDSVVPEGPLPNIDEIRPVIFSLKYTGEMVSWEDSTAGKLESKCLLEMSVLIGRRFTVGWGPKNQLTTLITSAASGAIPPSAPLSDLAMILRGRPPQDMRKTLVHRLQICGGVLQDPDITFLESVEPHLKIALDESFVNVDTDGIPSVVARSGVEGLHKHYSAAQELAKGSKDPLISLTDQVWGLCFALWGDLPDCEVPDSHSCMMQRREAVSEWLQTVVADSVKAEVSSYGQSDAGAVFSLLTGLNIANACARAQQLGDHRLSLLLSQACCGASVRVLMEKQLNEWRETEGDHYVSRDRIKSMMLVAGLPTHKSSSGVVNTCSGLDWRRAFAIHLWYICSMSSSVTDALQLYEKAFSGSGDNDDKYAVAPLPAYSADYIVENTGGSPIYDVMYHLLKLFSTKSHPLEQLLNPATHTPDPLDYRLSWFLMRVLTSIGYSHLSDHCISLIHSSFADQLESHGLWYWAVFILLHISNPGRRAATIQDLISRHITVDEETETETFLIESLNIPLTWIYESKATRAISENRFELAAKYLIRAENWNLGHSVIMEHIASKAIINEKYSYLQGLLEELKKDGRWKQISGWANGGSVIYDYLIVVQDVEDIVSRQDMNVGFHLERLKPLLTDLCMRLKLLPVRTPVDRLSQGEMAKRCSSLVRSLLLIPGQTSQEMSSETGVNFLTQLISELLLPNDYALQEWQAIAHLLVDQTVDRG